MPQKSVIFLLIFLIVNLTHACHSSCGKCSSGTTKYNCIECDDDMAMNGNLLCVGEDGNTTLLEIIDTTWDNTVSRYLYSMTFQANTFYSAATFPIAWTLATPLQLKDLTSEDRVGLYFNAIPENVYQLQVRASVSMDRNSAMCMWNSLTIVSSSATDFVTVNQFDKTLISYIDQPSQLAWIEYLFLQQSGNCGFLTFNDFTLLGYLCSTNCRTCLNQTFCLSCPLFGGTQYYLTSNGLCVDTCPLNYFDDPSTHPETYTCDVCDISCKRCHTSFTNCTVCNTDIGYVTPYNVANTCVLNCPDKQYKHINATSLYASTCLPCSSVCYNCIINPTRCISCGTSLGGQLYLHNFGCIFNCPTGTYANTNNFTCIKCDISCATCNGPLSSNCFTCATVSSGGTNTIYYMAIGAADCATTCPEGQFISVAIPNYCQQCSSLCRVCQGTATFCTSCPTGFYLSGNTCLSTCPAGTYADTTVLGCLPCDTACSTCFGAGTSSCYSCKTNSTGQVFYLSLGTTNCVPSCPDGQIIGSSNRCVTCAPQCAACSVITANCTKCLTISGVTSVFLQNNNCVQTCATGTYPQVATSGNLCISCHPTCSSCFGPLNTSCSSCTTYLTVVYYKDPKSSICNISCPAGYFGVSLSNTCSQCQTGCASCQINSTYCQGCQNVGSIPYYLFNNRCLNVCPNGYYPNLNTCSTCNISCAVCTGPSNSECSNCANATVGGVFTQYYLAIRTTTCAQFCPQGQYIDAAFPNSCQQCSSLCVYCFGNANNCTNGTCPFGYYFYINTCLSMCFAGTYGNSTSWQCLACHAACSTCFSGNTSSCYACRTDTVTNTTYYLQLGTTICSTSCPPGQITGTGNICLACASQCATCQVIQTNCTSCTVLNGASVYFQGETCTPTCLAGTYPKIGTKNNLCLPCNSTCSSCYGPLTTNCYSCTNTTTAGTTTVYFKYPTNPTCNTSCPQGYVGIASSNTCQSCQTGCVTCRNNTYNCQQCQVVGNIYYYFYNNSCLMICPDGTYKSNTDLTCNYCQYFTLNQQCIQQCPTGYIGVIKGSASICEGCTNCTSYNQPFTIKTTIIASSKNFMHEVLLSDGLSQSSTQQSISQGLQVRLFVRSRRLLLTLISLNVLSVSISPDYSTVIIITDSHPVDFSKTSVDIQFRAGALITPSGILYTALGSSIELQNPIFLASYYQAYGKDMTNQIQGIVLIILSTVLLVISLCLGNEETVNEMLMLVQVVQMVGLMRVRTFPVVLYAYNVLQGFSYLEFQYIPNPFTYFIPGFSPQEVALDEVKLAYGSQNIIGNFAPLLCILILVLLVEFIIYGAYKANQIKIKSMSLLIKATIQTFLFIILYGCLLSLASLQSNVLTNSNLLYISSIALSIIILIICLAYFSKHAKDITQKQFYKITNFFRLICLIILAHRFDMAVICFNASELITIIIQASRCAEAAANPFLRFMERFAVLAIINICLVIVEPRTLMIGVGSGFGLIFCIKLYHLIKTVYNYLQKEESESIVDAKSQALKLQQHPSNASQNFIYEENICEKKMGQLEKSFNQINQMRETALQNSFPKQAHPQLQPEVIINDYHLREMIKDNQEIGARRKRRFKIVEEKRQEKPGPSVEDFDNVEIIKVQQRLTTQQPQNPKNHIKFEPEFVSENSDHLEIISMN